VLGRRAQVGVLRVNRLRRKRKGQCNQDRCGESDQADPVMTAGVSRSSGTEGKSSG
jgi:hypothetical protein